MPAPDDHDRITVGTLTRWMLGLLAAGVIAWFGMLTRSAFAGEARVTALEQRTTDIINRLDRIENKLDAVLQSPYPRR